MDIHTPNDNKQLIKCHKIMIALVLIPLMLQFHDNVILSVFT